MPYLPALDGLRALAIVAVLFYHAAPGFLPGGFLGVDVFFVISAYLITVLLLCEARSSGRINLPDVWQRRARRLLPAVFTMLAALLLIAALFLRDELAGLRTDSLAAITYATNWYLIFSRQSYFETVGRPSLLRHLWSLAVEEQFYLIWPPLLIMLLRLRGLRWRLGLVLGGALLSILWMATLYQPDHDPSRVYYGSDTRAFTFLLGAALAFVWMPWRGTPKLSLTASRLWNLAGLAALTILVWFCQRVTPFESLLYPWGLLLVTGCAVVLIAVAVRPQLSAGLSWLSSRPLRWLGLRSYSIYLWHWPIFMLTRPGLDVPLDGLPLFALRLALTLLSAEISYRFVETPARTGALGRACSAWWQKRAPRRAIWAGVCLLLLGMLGALGVATTAATVPPPPLYLASLDDAAPPYPLPDPIADTRLAPDVAPAVPEPPFDWSGSAGSIQVEAESVVEPAPLKLPSAALLTASDMLPLEPTAAADEASPNPPGGEPASASPLDPQGPPSISTLAPVAVATPVPASILSPGTRITAIGDSVMASAAGELRRVLGAVEIDAVLGRQTWTTVDRIRYRQTARQLGDIIVLQTGDNGYLSARQFNTIMDLLSAARRVVMVNVRVPREWETNNNDIVRGESPRYPNLVLVNWYDASADRPEFFWSDGMHLRLAGTQAYASLVAAAITSP